MGILITGGKNRVSQRKTNIQGLKIQTIYGKQPIFQSVRLLFYLHPILAQELDTHDFQLFPGIVSVIELLLGQL